jgi:hypothetical protein
MSESDRSVIAVANSPVAAANSARQLNYVLAIYRKTKTHRLVALQRLLLTSLIHAVVIRDHPNMHAVYQTTTGNVKSTRVVINRHNDEPHQFHETANPLMFGR